MTGYKIYRNGVHIADSANTRYTDTDLEPGTYVYSVSAYDASGNISDKSSEIIYDNEPPTAPEEISVVEATATSVTLNWLESSDNIGVLEYEVYRDGIKVADLEDLSYKDESLEPMVEYTYFVKARDLSGNLSERSEIVTVETFVDDEPPTTPKELRVASQTGSSITLTWNASVDNVGVEGFDAAGNYSDKSSEIIGIPMIPRITETDPANEETVGGTSNRMHVYFVDSGNIQGSDAVFEYSEDGSKWTEFEGMVHGPYRRQRGGQNLINFYSDWDLEPLSSGDYMVRYTVYDADGNTDEHVASYTVNRTSPDMVENLNVLSESTGIILTWDGATEGYVSHYNIYRSVNDEESFSLLKRIDDPSTISYIDNSILAETTYYYYVTAVDIFGQESTKSEVVEITTSEDVIPPMVMGISPVDETTLGKSAQITVRAEDNIAVSSMTLQYFDNSKDNWVDIETIKTSRVANFVWEDIPVSDEIKVRAIAKDSSGNISDGTPVRTYYIKDEEPEKVTGLNASPYATNILLRWNDVSDDDFAYFLVEKKNSVGGSYERVGTVNDTLGMNVTDLETETTYYFRVAAYDIYGNKGEYSD
ncbi:fibronectin type III domain-containing protein [Herbivorax sp. ANBcel31]|nr:fibronectin type III domain-containing protein [Herbivorax sp. ANBcel31]MDQ2085050.1 fibronectin type III domain-containing protein [Herbivorax sp. ANBcel31]